MSNPQQLHGLQPTRLLHPWDFPGKGTGVGCHCLLQTESQFSSTILVIFFFFLHYGFNMTEDSLALTPLTLDGFSNSKEDYSVTKGVLLVIPFMDHCLFMAKGFV